MKEVLAKSLRKLINKTSANVSLRGPVWGRSNLQSRHPMMGGKLLFPAAAGEKSMFLSSALFCLIVIGLLISCHKKGEISADAFWLPFPDAKMAAFYQARVDSSEFLWFTDVKATASSFMNEEVPGSNISTGDVVIISEGLFHAQAEVQLPDKKLLLTMKRPFEEKGDNSIWQVVKVEEKKWPKGKSKSATSQ